MNIILFDTETHDIKNPRLVQLGWLDKRIQPEKVSQEFFKPFAPITFGAMSINHITNEMVESAPYFDNEKARHYQLYFNGATAVAHNLPFDTEVMRNEGVNIENGICTLKLARKFFPNEEQHKLQYLRYSLGLDIKEEVDAHDAKGDVIVLNALFEKIYKVMCDLLATNDEGKIIKEMIEITKQPSIINILHFGKNKGKKISDILVEAPDYLEWLLKQKTLDKDLEYSIKYFKRKKNTVDNNLEH